MNQTETMKEFDELIHKMKVIHDKKCHDYAREEDRFSNFRLSELSGIPAWHGILIRIGDKFSRLSEFAKNNKFEVKDENIEDTFIDLANYALLGLMAYNDMRRRENGSKEEEKYDKIKVATTGDKIIGYAIR